MPAIHLNNDKRSCGATTKVVGQSTVYINGELVSVEGDISSHGAGGLKADNNSGNFFINGKKVVFDKSNAYMDNFGHLNPSADGGSSDVFSG